MFITVYADTVEEVTKRLDRLAKKAERYGVRFGYQAGEEHPERVRVMAYDEANHEYYEKESYTVAAVDIFIDCDGFIKSQGWQVLAKIEHGMDRDDKACNIVTAFGASDPAWYGLAPACDHCHSNRFRKVTFVVEKDGERRQVGSSCLKEYTGIDPATAAMWAEVRDLSDMGEDGLVAYEGCGYSHPKMFEAADVIALAIDSIKEYGYRKADMPNCTKGMVLDALDAYKDPSAEAKAKATEVVEWLKERYDRANADDAILNALYQQAFRSDETGYEWCEDEEKSRLYYAKQEEINFAWDAVNDIERNCAAMVKGGYVKANHVGRLCYIPIDYDKYLERKAEAERRAAAHEAEKSSQFVGAVGDRITVTAVAVKLVASWDTQYGTTYLYKWQDAAGNVFVWFASRRQDMTDGVTIKGTVKDHSERDGVKQTVLTRCKV